MARTAEAQVTDQTIVTQVVPPFHMAVFYEQAKFRFRVEVQHESDEAKKSTEYVACNHEPMFGIDVADMGMIRQTAEAMCRRLEGQPEPEPEPPPPVAVEVKPLVEVELPAITLWTPIDECGLPVRAVNALKNEGFRFIGEIVEAAALTGATPRAYILRMPNVGLLTADQIMAVVGPLEGKLTVTEADFIDWCRRNRPALEALWRGLQP
jgi:DNA-directed RNA polymerase alpha subunit